MKTKINLGIYISNNLEISYALKGKLKTIFLEEISDKNNLKQKLKGFIKILERNYKCYKFKATVVLAQTGDTENEFEIKKSIIGSGIEIQEIFLEKNIELTEELTISQWASLSLESESGLKIKERRSI